MDHLSPQSLPPSDQVLWPIRQYGCIDEFTTSCRDFGLAIRRYAVLAFEGLCEIIRQIFDTCMKCLCCCRNSQNKEQELINQNTTKRQIKPIVKSGGEAKLQSEDKTKKGVSTNTSVKSDSFADESDDDTYGALTSESSSEYEIGLMQSVVSQFPKAPTSPIPNNRPVVPVLPKVGLSSSQVDKIAQKTFTSEKELDERIGQLYQFSDSDEMSLHQNQDEDEGVEFLFDDEEIIGSDENGVQSGEGDDQISDPSDASSPNLISQKSFKVHSAVLDSNLKSSYKQALEEASKFIKDNVAPSICAKTFYAYLKSAISNVSQDKVIELICFLITNPNEIKDRIGKAVGPKLDLDSQLDSNKLEAKYKRLAEIHEKRIKELQASFLEEFSVFIGGQLFADDRVTVQRIVNCIKDCGKHEIEEQNKMLSQIMNQLTKQLMDNQYSFDDLQFYINFMGQLASQGARISDGIQPEDNTLLVEYSSEEDDASLSSDLNDSEKFYESAIDLFKFKDSLQKQEKYSSDIEKYHESAIDFLKVQASLQMLKEQFVNQFNQNKFKDMLIDIIDSISKISPSNEWYRLLISSCRKYMKIYFFRDPNISTLNEIKWNYSKLAEVLDLSKFEALVRLKNLKSEQVEITTFQNMLSEIAKNLEGLENSNFLYDFLKIGFSSFLDRYFDILSNMNSKDSKSDTFREIKLSYDAIAKKLNYPCCPEPDFLLDPNFMSKYVGLQILEAYSSKKLELNSFEEMLSSVSECIENIDSAHPLYTRLRKAFDDIILRYTGCQIDFKEKKTSELVKRIKTAYTKLAKILGCEIVEMDIDTKEASKKDTGMASQLNFENFKTYRSQTKAQVNNLKFEYDLTDAGAVAQTWAGYLKNLLQYMPQEAAVMMLLLTFQKELNLKGLPQLLEDNLDWEQLLKVLSNMGRTHIQKIGTDYNKYLNTFLSGGFSETEATELLSAILQGS